MANIDSTASNTDRMREHLFRKQMRGTQQHEQEEDLSMCSNVVNFRLSVCLNGLEPHDKKHARTSAAPPPSSSSSSSSSSASSCTSSPSKAGAAPSGKSGAAASSETEPSSTAGKETSTPAAEGTSAAAERTSSAAHTDTPAASDVAGTGGAPPVVDQGAAAKAVKDRAAADEGGGAVVGAGQTDVQSSSGEATAGGGKDAAADQKKEAETEKASKQGADKDRSTDAEGAQDMKEQSEKVTTDRGDSEKAGEDGGQTDDSSSKGSSDEGVSSLLDAGGKRHGGSSRDVAEKFPQQAKVSEGGEVATLKDVLLANPTDKCLVSDVDEQMLINIFFNSPVRITSIAIRSTVPPPEFEWKRKTGNEDEDDDDLPEDGTVAEPKVIKVHSNNSNLDFSTVLDETPAQVITLTPQQLKGEERLPLRGSKFQRCSSLHLFIEKNQANAMHTFLNRICLFGYVNRIYVS